MSTAYKQSREEQRTFALAEYKKGCRSGKELFQKLTKKYKSNEYQAAEKTLYLWMKQMKEGTFDVQEKRRCGRPKTTGDKRVLEAIERDPYISVTDLYCEFDIPRSVTRLAVNRGGLINVNGKWVPKEITPEHQKLRIDHSLYMIKRVEADPFLDRVIFEGEKYLTYNKYKKHFKTKDAKNVLRPTEELIAQSGLKPHRVVLHVFWTQQGMIMYKLFGESDRTQDFYLKELDELRLQLEEKTMFLRDDKPWILYFNSDRYLSEDVKQKIFDFGWEGILHPKHCPDMSPTDYHIFQKLQFAFNTTTFTQFEEVQEFVHRYFDTRRSKFYQDALGFLNEKWLRIIETEGEYIPNFEKP